MGAEGEGGGGGGGGGGGNRARFEDILQGRTHLEKLHRTKVDVFNRIVSMIKKSSILRNT